KTDDDFLNPVNPMFNLKSQFERFNRDQQGAIALLVLAALMALLMMGLVILDTGDAAREKITVQSAADAAAWSEAAVEARAMNMMALANIGKRITIGMTAFYDALWYSFGAIAAMIGIVATISCIAAFFTAG